MKNKNIILYGIVALVVLFGIFLVYTLAFKKDAYSNLISIGIQELQEKIDNKERFVLVVTQTGCSHCEQYLPELNRTLKEIDYKAYTLNISNLSEEEHSTLTRYANFSGTPTTMFFIDGEETTTLNRIVGYATKDKIKDKLQSLGYVD